VEKETVEREPANTGLPGKWGHYNRRQLKPRQHGALQILYFFVFEMTLSASTPGFDMHQQPRCFDCVMNTVKTHVSG